MRHLSLVILLALGACATTDSSDDGMLIETSSKGQALAGAECTVRTAGGSWSVVTPGSIGKLAVEGDLHVLCNKPGYRTSEFVYRSSGYSGSSMGLSVGGGGGHVGLGVGMSVPIGSRGKGYPAKITVEMNPQ